MNRNIERYLPLPLLIWRTLTQPAYIFLGWLVDSRLIDLGIKILLRKEDE